MGTEAHESAAGGGPPPATAGRAGDSAETGDRLVVDLKAQAKAVVDRGAIAHLGVALTSARQIGAAVGVIVSATKVSESDAFEVLVMGQSELNRKAARCRR